MSELAALLRSRLSRGHSPSHSPLMNIQQEDSRITAPLSFSPAAVLVAVTDRPQPGVILTRRASHMRNHAGQVAFPGGRTDPDDRDAIATALREAQEEIALSPDAATIIGTSDPYRTFTGFDIMPVLAVIPPDLPLSIHQAEVESLFEVPLDFLLSPTNRITKEMEFAGQPHQYYEILWQDYRIWGITAAIIANLSKRLGYEPGPD